jgi:L-xylulokinase
MTAYFLGVDNGGTATKAVIFDDRGNDLAGASRKVPMILPEPGFTERDMEQLWKANCEAIREAIATAGIPASAIRGVALTGHGKGLYLWGKDGKPAYNGIVSTDSRAWAYPERWEKDGTAARVFPRTFQRILACQPVSLLRWLEDNRPGVVERTRWIFEVKDYVRFRLTGEAFAEVTDYSGSSLMDLRTVRFEKELLAEYGLAHVQDKLPPVKYSTEPCGAVSAEAAAATGLAVGTPVAGGMFDIDACAVAVDVTDEENLCVIAGTWSINEYISRTPVVNHSVMMNSLFCLPGYYLVEECSPTSAGNNEWFTNLFLQAEKDAAAARGISVYELTSELAGSVPPDGQSIVFLPYIYGSNDDPQARACFVGLDASHTRPQIIRAVYEGIAFCHLVHVERLLANRARTRAVRLAGGAANSPVWAQMFADVFQLPVETVAARELGTLGAAMAAAVAGGVYRDLAEAARHMVKRGARYEPDPAAAAIYRRKYASYRKVSAALAGIWKDL